MTRKVKFNIIFIGKIIFGGDVMQVYKKQIWSKFIKAVKEFEMIKNGDRIAIGVSGGKDSLLLLTLFKELKKDRSFNFEIEPITLNPGFKESDLADLKKNLDIIDIKYDIYDTDIWEAAFKMSEGGSPCFMCAKMRRGILYRRAEELNCNKLALGHHFDDVIETTMINMFYAGTLKTMLPKVKSTSGNFDLIRPLVYIKEKDIISYVNNSGLKPMRCGCPIEEGKVDSKRKEIKNMLEELEKTNPLIKKSIFNSMRNINTDYVMGCVSGNKNRD